MIEQGSPVRVKLVDGSNHAGLVVNMDEGGLLLQCIYKFVPASQSDGMEEQVMEVMGALSIKELLMIAINLDVLKKAMQGLAIGQKKGLTTVMSTAMMEAMEDVLIAQQSPVNKFFPIESLLEISSLVDEGQEKLFERWASSG